MPPSTATRRGPRRKAGKSGPLLIVAGAGTGKTNTLAHRVAWLVLAGVEPDRILLLTFTRRAAQEMTRRAQRIVDASLRERAGDAQRWRELRWAGTFHSIANRLLRQYARNLGLDPGFSVLDRGDSADLMDVVRHERGLSASAKRFPRKDTCLAIYSHRVNTQCELEDDAARAVSLVPRLARELKASIATTSCASRPAAARLR